MQLDEVRESSVDLAFGAGLQDSDLYRLRARRFLHISGDTLGIRIIRVYEHGDYASLGNQLGNQLEPFGHQLDVDKADAGEIAARPARLATRPRSTGSPTLKTIG